MSRKQLNKRIGSFFVFISAFLYALSSLGEYASCDLPGLSSTHLTLVLAIDVSGSIDRREMDLQMRGYQKALESDEIKRILKSIHCTAIGVVFWAEEAKIAFPLTRIDNDVDYQRLIDLFAGVEMIKGTKGTPATLTWGHNSSLYMGSTNIIGGIEQARTMQLKFPGRVLFRRIIDVSGDGVQNVSTAWDQRISPTGAHSPLQSLVNVLAKDPIIINGLAIENIDYSLPQNEEALIFFRSQTGGKSSMLEYYRDEVITPALGFVEPAADFWDFPRAIKKKLLRELSPSAIN